MIRHPSVITKSDVLLLPVLAEALAALLVEVALPDWDGSARPELRLVLRDAVAVGRVPVCVARLLARREQVGPAAVLPGRRGRGGRRASSAPGPSTTFLAVLLVAVRAVVGPVHGDGELGLVEQGRGRHSHGGGGDAREVVAAGRTGLLVVEVSRGGLLRYEDGLLLLHGRQGRVLRVPVARGRREEAAAEGASD